jgi:hypothetical protein
LGDAKLTARQDLACSLVFAIAFVGLSVWALAEGDDGKGALYLALGAAWLLVGLWRQKRFYRTGDPL